MEKKIYLLSTENTEQFYIDISLSKKLKECHLKEKVDTLFLPENSELPVVVRYCEENKIGKIEKVIISNQSFQNSFLDIYRYVNNNPKKKRFANYCNSEDVSSLEKLLKQDNFNVKVSSLL